MFHILLQFTLFSGFDAGRLSGDCTTTPHRSLPLIAHSVDLTTVNLFPLDNGTVQKASKLTPLLKLTCRNESNRWSDNSRIVQWPDQVARVRSKKQDSLLGPAFVELLKGIGDFRDQMEDSISNGNFRWGVMSATELFQAAQRWILQEDKTIGFFTQSYYRYEVFLQPVEILKQSLSESFTKAIQDLKQTTFADNSDRFKAFLDIFGTHYFARINFGYKLRAFLVFNDSYALKQGSANLHSAISAYIKETLGKKTSKTEDALLLDDARKAGTLFQSYSWGPKKRLWMIGGVQLEPLSSLIDDEATSDQVQLAIDNHLARAALSEWKLSLQMITLNAPKSWFLFPECFKIAKIIQQIDGLLGKGILDESEVQQMKEQADRVITLAESMKGNKPKYDQ